MCILATVLNYRSGATFSSSTAAVPTLDASQEAANCLAFLGARWAMRSGHYPIRKDEVVRPAVLSVRYVTLSLGNGTTELNEINWQAGVGA
jgi:hypothetical protein